MPRPIKCRQVCCLPACNRFGPIQSRADEPQYIQMTIDEYETIRLIDLEDLNQEECAARMNVARTTVQAIYNGARKKLAESLVRGKMLRIEGGEYKLCEGQNHACGKEKCNRRNFSEIV
ncbi:MAG: DUF134 domain-containing protein [Selenomonadaceae bacterium]